VCPRWGPRGAGAACVRPRQRDIRVAGGASQIDAEAAATSTDATAPGKTHYAILDGLRGVAALLVVVFHLFEAHALGSHENQIINHGYLAVDFFFLLSGFVVAYAYDDRWGRMTQWEFYKRRLVRLQPMIIMGSLIGAATFYFQTYPIFPNVGSTPVWMMLIVMIVGFTLIPLPASMDIRGWSESYPLNGPAWSLFYEYCANFLYAAGLRKLSVRALAVLVFLAALPLAHLATFGKTGDLVGGWSLDAEGLRIGFTRVIFPFFAGVLLMRLGWRIRVRHAFALCSVLLILAMSLPRFGGTEYPWINGLYESACVILLFPLIVAIGAGEERVDGASVRIARFFGGLSYPIYMTHYPLIYIYTGWVMTKNVSLAQGAPVAIAVLIGTIIIAYASLTFYDVPLRRWLSGKLLKPRRVD
jgi:peptidoglycan/LPS O-acetylase OafA/YrhL